MKSSNSLHARERVSHGMPTAREGANDVLVHAHRGMSRFSQEKKRENPRTVEESTAAKKRMQGIC
jgi:hypothetical protein